jgi:hypothetical protein
LPELHEFDAVPEEAAFQASAEVGCADAPEEVRFLPLQAIAAEFESGREEVF